jgi:hypothetical protein
MEFVFFVLLVVFMFLCVKTIKLQGARILKLETFVSEYLEGKRESIHERTDEELPSVHAVYQGRHRASQE